MPSPDALPSDEIHMHIADDPAITAPALLARYDAMLDPEEAARRDRFHFAQHRHQFLVARALVRSTLSLYRPDIKPAEWQFAANAYGRPRIVGDGAGALDFNLSHTDGRIVLAVCRARSPGVDIERLDRLETVTHIAARFFAERETRALLALPPLMQRRRFFDLWTLKEAYIKARGMGLSIPLTDFSIHFPAEGAPAIHFADGVDDEASRWQLWSFDAGEDYALSLAISGAGPLRPRQFQSIPLMSVKEIDCRILAPAKLVL
jgi:4'-phosphopantetheinyl transferase